MRKVQWVWTLTILLGFAANAFGHAGGAHVMGTVKAVDDKSITVADADGEETKIAIDDKTTVEQSGKAAMVKDIKSGERVVVHTRKGDNGPVAVLIKFGKVDKAHAGHHDDDHGDHHDGEQHNAQPAK